MSSFSRTQQKAMVEKTDTQLGDNHIPQSRERVSTEENSSEMHGSMHGHHLYASYWVE